ncbi:FRG domain-containing protein [Rathayibacter sp. AY1D1]|uniref:FRG domain-containing protein n=1 Tax=Rathayibacter sp. AY1D1 TaxID=2080542 RepID=UPI0035BE8A4D
MWLHATFKNHVWLWRGQARGDLGVEPGMHTRVINSNAVPHDETVSANATSGLLKAARRMRLDRQDGNRLPDLALLANLQHHGAATPLLDVSTDPLIALWMVAFASASDPDALDHIPGSLFGIKRPPKERWIDPLDARPYTARSSSNISDALAHQVWWYRAPDVTERLRIQRGSFLIGPLVRPTDRFNTTLPFDLAADRANAISNRLEKRGEASNGNIGRVEIFRIIIPGASKVFLRRLLEDRSGLSIETIYPTPWHRPFIAQFASTYGRGRPLGLDSIVAAGKTDPRARAVENESAGEVPIL